MENLNKLVDRCNEMDITEQLNIFGDASIQYNAKLELSALREAGEKMAEVLKFIQLQNDAAHLESAGLWSVNGETEIQVAEAREAWEAANK